MRNGLIYVSLRLATVKISAKISHSRCRIGVRKVRNTFVGVVETFTIFAWLAQWLERGTHNPLVGDSNSSLRTTHSTESVRVRHSLLTNKKRSKTEFRPAVFHRRVTERTKRLNIWRAKFLKQFLKSMWRRFAFSRVAN